MVRSWLLAAAVLMSGCEGTGHPHLSRPGPSVEGASRTSVAEAPTSPAGPLAVPDVVGEKYNVAQVELASIGPDAWLEAVYRWVHEPAVPAGTVSAQSPPAGTMLANGSPVSLTISLGPDYVAGAPPCRASILRTGPGSGVSEKTGQHTLDLSLTNRSAVACLLEGYPTVRMLDAAGRPLGFRYTHGGDQMTTAAAPTAVYLPPGAAAWIRLNKYRCDVAETDHSQTVILGLPGGGGALPVPATDFSYCAAEVPSLSIAVSPFEPVEDFLGSG